MLKKKKNVTLQARLDISVQWAKQLRSENSFRLVKISWRTEVNLTENDSLKELLKVHVRAHHGRRACAGSLFPPEKVNIGGILTQVAR